MDLLPTPMLQTPRASLLLAVALLCATSFPAVAQDADTNAVVDPAFLQAFDFRMVGPHRGGRVTAVAGYPSHPPALYFGAAGGGVWKTTNNGLSYRNLTDGYLAVGSIGAIAVASADSKVVYVGTGSACIRSNVSTGRGVYKSLDAGDSWMFAGLPEAGQIGAIVIHPDDPDLVYVAALGHPFGPNPERGVYRSYDGGDTWEQVLYVSDSTGAVALSMNPADPNEIYAAMWRAERKPWTIISGGVEGGLFKTEDAGDTWTRLRAGLPSGLVGRIDVAVSPADPRRVYALFEAPGDSAGLYRSDNAGASFERINTQKSLTYRPFYYTHVHADPLDSDRVYVSNETFFVSSDAGASFRRIDTPHGDHHALWIHPRNPRVLFQGNDGGATVSLDAGDTWSSLYNQPTAELYHVVVDNRVPYRLYGEQQDNTTISVPSLSPTAAAPLHPIQHWEAVAGCETGPIAVHPTDPDIIYGGCKGRFSRYNRRTGQEKQYWVYPHFNYGHAAEDMPYRFQRTAPIEVSPHDPSVIYTASQFVHRTSDEGVHWEVISPDLTAFEPGKQGYSGGPITRDITGEEIYSAIYQLRESPLEEGVLWAGSNDGPVHLSLDAGATWTDITPDSLPPGGRVQTIEPSPHRRGSAFIAVYRYMLDDWQPYIFRTDDYGAHWTRLTDGTNGIPADHPVRVVREDPDRAGLLYAGTEFGLFVSFDAGAHWQPLQRDLPATPVTDIRVHRKDLVLSTMGRSFWILDDLSPLHRLEPGGPATHRLFPPRDLLRLRWDTPGERFDGANPEYPPSGALIYYFVGNDEEAPVSLEILDDAGTVIRSYSSDGAPSGNQRPATMHEPPGESSATPALARSAGMHRVAWDLRYEGPESLDSEHRPEQGPLVPPGTYRVRLRIGAWTATESFTLRMDPRVEADGVTPADIEAQALLALRVRDALTALRQTVIRIRTLKTRLEERRQAMAEGDDLARRIAGLVQRLDAIERRLVQTGEGKVGAQLQPRLMRQFTYLYGMLDTADQRPGEDAYLRMDDLDLQWNEHLRDLEQVIETGLAPLNQALEAMGQSPVNED